jgi:2-keto-4-pentenoate hydratase/2-oxohepta-3-ene-1,7-dioic acid hydratase in catechol pathway
VAPGGPAGAPAWSFAPGTAVLGSAADASIPAGEEHLDVEARLAVWVSRPLHGATPTQGEAAILGYSVAAVLVARDLAATSPAGAMAVGMVMGPWITTADEVDEPMAALLRLRRNKEIVGEGAASDAIFAPGEMLALISNYTPLCAGAVLLVGTAATPVARGLVAGDQVEVSAGELGSVRMRIT